MKRLITAAILPIAFFCSCQSARTQNQSQASAPQPQVVVVPTDELSREPSVGPATNAGATAAAQATPAQELRGDSSDMQMSLPPPATQTASAGPRISYNSCNVNGPYIAMTFDDGPNPELTPKLLDMLKARGIKATFFVVGQNAAQYPEILKRMVAEGHEIGNHSWSHPALTKLGVDGVKKQIESTNAAIEQATGQKVTVMRPPYGATSQILNRRYYDQYGMKVILWSVDPLDWKYRNSARVSAQIIQSAHPGAIILAHDIHATTVGAMPETFDALLAKGYKFVTVSELIAMDQPAQLVKREEPKPQSAPAAPAQGAR
ncbi:polysaccharide deacetylase family protein [Spartobacteria bacterium LR76]|nr:polysaccharide deacetylase family protein [Spartobacteria bacterium LR76]